MRLLFILLLLANLLLLAWNAWVATPLGRPGQAVRITEPGPNRIRLLSELPSGDPPVSAAAAPLPGADCVSVGPFGDRVAAERTLSRLGDLGFVARLRAATGELNVGQWVRVVNLATAGDAENALAALRAAGATDAEILDDGGVVVSLGVFGDSARTQAAMELARQAGYPAQASERRRVAEVYWLDVDRRGNGGLPAPEDLVEAGGSQPPFGFRACPTPPAAAGG